MVELAPETMGTVVNRLRRAQGQIVFLSLA